MVTKESQSEELINKCCKFEWERRDCYDNENVYVTRWNWIQWGPGGRRFKGLKFDAGAMGQKLRLISESHQWVLSERKIWTAPSKIHVFITLPAIDVHITKVGTFTYCCGRYSKHPVMGCRPFVLVSALRHFIIPGSNPRSPPSTPVFSVTFWPSSFSRAHSLLLHWHCISLHISGPHFHHLNAKRRGQWIVLLPDYHPRDCTLLFPG